MVGGVIHRCARTAVALEHPGVLLEDLRILRNLSNQAVLPLCSPVEGFRATGSQRAAGAIMGRWLPAAAVAGVAAVLGMAAGVGGGAFQASGEAPAPVVPVAESLDEQTASLRQLRDWLRSQGADISRVEIKHSQAGPGAGLGLFASAAVSSPRPGGAWWSWLWSRRGGSAPREPTSLAAFPLSSAITVRTACSDPQLGQQFSWMLDKQLLDERTAVMVYLLIERLRGDKSRYSPWIRSLPTTFDVPIAFTEKELEALRGTTLYRATAAMIRRMQETWSRLEGPLTQVARDLGLPAPSWSDWVWAYCVFWSRGQSLPVPESGTASSALMGHSSVGSDKIPIQILEGLVPGLDFCNHRHAPLPQCWWEVVAPERLPKPPGEEEAPSTSPMRSGAGPGPAAPSSGPGAGEPMVRLHMHTGGHVRPGEELFISYGEKSNEELLMLYGFALEGNPHDHLMLYCPLPPQAEWDDVMYARMELLQAYGLRPQFFLPHPDQVASETSASKPSRSRGATAAGKKTGTGEAVAAAEGTGDEAVAPPLALPGEVLDTLEVFILNFQELAVRSKALQAKMEERRIARAEGTPLAATSQHSPVLDLASLRARYERMSPAELRHFMQALGLRMATLTTFIKLLELKVVDLEGEDGTGSLEGDQRLLAAMQAGEEQSGAARPQDRRLRGAVVYRLGQKQLARAWLVRAKAELRNLLSLLRDMTARQEALERSRQ